MATQEAIEMKENILKAKQSAEMALDDLRHIQKHEGNCLAYERAACALAYALEQFEIKLNEKGGE